MIYNWLRSKGIDNSRVASAVFSSRMRPMLRRQLTDYAEKAVLNRDDIRAFMIKTASQRWYDNRFSEILKAIIELVEDGYNPQYGNPENNLYGIIAERYPVLMSHEDARAVANELNDLHPINVSSKDVLREVGKIATKHTTNNHEWPSQDRRYAKGLTAVMNNKTLSYLFIPCSEPYY